MKVKQAALVLGAFAIVMSPIAASAADDSASTTVTATVGSTISMTTSGTVAFSLTPTASGVVSSGSDTVSVSTNNTAGYNLTLANTDANTYLDDGTNTIPAHSGTFAAPTVLDADTWGYAIAGGAFSGSYSAELNNGSSTSLWAGVPSSASPQELKDTSTTATDDETTVWYAARVTTAKPNGAYADSVTYTATTN